MCTHGDAVVQFAWVGGEPAVQQILEWIDGDGGLEHGLWVLFSIGAPSARRALDAAEDEIRDRWGSLLWTLQRERWERDSAELWSALSGR